MPDTIRIATEDTIDAAAKKSNGLSIDVITCTHKSADAAENNVGKWIENARKGKFPKDGIEFGSGSIDKVARPAARNNTCGVVVVECAEGWYGVVIYKSDMLADSDATAGTKPAAPNKSAAAGPKKKASNKATATKGADKPAPLGPTADNGKTRENVTEDAEGYVRVGEHARVKHTARGMRAHLFGEVNMIGALQWMGRQGFSVASAMEALGSLGLKGKNAPKPATVQINLSFGRRPDTLMPKMPKVGKEALLKFKA